MSTYMTDEDRERAATLIPPPTTRRPTPPPTAGGYTYTAGMAEADMRTRYLGFLIAEAKEAQGEDRRDLLDRIERVVGVAPKPPVMRSTADEAVRDHIAGWRRRTEAEAEAPA